MPDSHDTSLTAPERGARAHGARVDHSEPPPALVLDDALLDELAERLAERLLARLGAPEPQEALVDAREIARMSGKTRRWVYEHARELGAVPLGSGSRPRLGFSPSSALTQIQSAAAKATVPAPPPAGGSIAGAGTTRAAGARRRSRC